MIMCRHVPINASFFKYGTHCLTWPRHNAEVNHLTGGALHVLSPFTFSSFTNIQPGGEWTLIIITFKRISSHQEGRPARAAPIFSLFGTHSVVFVPTCVCVCVYSNTVCLRADSTFAYTHCCLVYFCMNATQRFFQATVKGVTYSMWNFIIVYHTGMCVKLHQHGTRQLQHNTRK